MVFVFLWCRWNTYRPEQKCLYIAPGCPPLCFPFWVPPHCRGKSFKFSYPWEWGPCKQIHRSCLHNCLLLTLPFFFSFLRDPPPLHSRNVECTWTGSCMRKNDCWKSPTHLFRDRSFPSRFEKNHYPLILVLYNCGVVWNLKQLLYKPWKSAAFLLRKQRDSGYTEK